MLSIIKKYLIGPHGCLLLATVLVVPQISHAYTGITIVMSTSSTTNLEFVETFRAELSAAKAPNLRIKLIDLSESEKLVVAENSELVIALGKTTDLYHARPFYLATERKKVKRQKEKT